MLKRLQRLRNLWILLSDMHSPDRQSYDSQGSPVPVYWEVPHHGEWNVYIKGLCCYVIYTLLCK